MDQLEKVWSNPCESLSCLGPFCAQCRSLIYSCFGFFPEHGGTQATPRLSQNMRDRDVRSWRAQARVELTASVLAFLGGSTGLWCFKFGMVAGISWYVHWIGAVWFSCLPDGLQRFETSFLTKWFGPEGAAAHRSSGCQKKHLQNGLVDTFVFRCIQMFGYAPICTCYFILFQTKIYTQILGLCTCKRRPTHFVSNYVSLFSSSFCQSFAAAGDVWVTRCTLETLTSQGRPRFSSHHCYYDESLICSQRWARLLTCCRICVGLWGPM